MDKKWMQKEAVNSIENLRRVVGTLPSENPGRSTNYLDLSTGCEVTLEDHSKNPYKAMFVTSTATWGDNKYEQKWEKTSLKGKLEVIKAVLTNNTLPQAREMVNFIFRVRGVPRWLFDYHTQVKFTSFMSVGCRDNNKIDCDFIFDKKKDSLLSRQVFEDLKDLYQDVLADGNESWQSARTFLPQCYQHSYHFGQNLLSIASMNNFRSIDNDKDDALSKVYEKILKSIQVKFPLIAEHVSSIFFRDNESRFKYISELQLNNLEDEDILLFKETD
jgi:hypothetical protein